MQITYTIRREQAVCIKFVGSKETMRKRFIALLLCIIMMLLALPSVVFAEYPTEYWNALNALNDSASWGDDNGIIKHIRENNPNIIVFQISSLID